MDRRNLLDFVGNARLSGYGEGEGVDQFKITTLDWGTIGARLVYLSIKITPALREYFRYSGISAELERRGYGSSRPQVAWAIRQKQHEPEKPADDENKGGNSSSPSVPDSN